ncbi:hypothetical protein AMR41_22325 [Hapalosiphon sp. MRB220]|nr:hypothetical protein AMR41_22325 [Hapalosiphon sp. MRB220]
MVTSFTGNPNSELRIRNANLLKSGANKRKIAIKRLVPVLTQGTKNFKLLTNNNSWVLINQIHQIDT